MAARFAKTSSQRLQTVSAFTPPTAGSVGFWLHLTSFPGGSGRYRFVGNQTELEIAYYDVDNTIRYQFLTSGPGAVSASNLLALNTWYHLVGTYNMSTGAVLGYLNGAQVASATGTGENPASGLFGIGQAIWATDGWTDGVIDDVRIYNRVLPLDEIQTMHVLRGADEIYVGLQHRWMMREGAPGTTITGIGVVKDHVGGLHCSPSNAPTFAESMLSLRRRAA